jgi:hypothetical protein
MIQQLAKLRGVGVQSATVLVREGFVRKFAIRDLSRLEAERRARDIGAGRYGEPG